MWFWKGSDTVRLQTLEERILRLEAKMTSAADLLDATERMDRIIKRSFRLNRQLEELEKLPAKTGEEVSRGTPTREQLVKRLYG